MNKKAQTGLRLGLMNWSNKQNLHVTVLQWLKKMQWLVAPSNFVTFLFFITSCFTWLYCKNKYYLWQKYSHHHEIKHWLWIENTRLWDDHCPPSIIQFGLNAALLKWTNGKLDGVVPTSSQRLDSITISWIKLWSEPTEHRTKAGWEEMDSTLLMLGACTQSEVMDCVYQMLDF